MLIAKLRISLRDAGIAYNSATELETTKARGTVLTDGKVVRGLGTHFANQAAKERFDRLTKDSNTIREAFNRKFLRTPIEGTFVVNTKGEAKAYIASQTINPELFVSVMEFELGAADEGLDKQEMDEWGKRVKAQLERIPLGRAETVSNEGIDALEELSKCPVLAPATREAIGTLIAQAKVGQINRIDFKRSIELMDVTMDQGTLVPKRPVLE
jgi:hypothetical protein